MGRAGTSSLRDALLPVAREHAHNLCGGGILHDLYCRGRDGVVITRLDRSHDPERDFVWHSFYFDGERWACVQGHYDLTRQQMLDEVAEYLDRFDGEAS